MVWVILRDWFSFSIPISKGISGKSYGSASATGAAKTPERRLNTTMAKKRISDKIMYFVKSYVTRNEEAVRKIGSEV